MPGFGFRRAIQGAVLALGAPLGWLAIQALAGKDPLAALRSEPWLYLYMMVGTVTAFAAFGLVLGRHEETLKKISIPAALPGRGNRRYFQIRFDEEFASARRHGRPLSVVEFDLDFFKAVNDKYGHPAGDRVLAGVA